MGVAIDASANSTHLSDSTTSKWWVIVAVLASIADAEQYYSADSRMARSTFYAASVRPLTTKCMWMRVNTLGSCCARSASISTTTSSTAALLQNMDDIEGCAA